MADPSCPQKAPYGVDLAPGDYYWRSCGQSKNQPFCGGSHKGSDFTPRKFTLALAEEVWLCGCKRTGKTPFCDGKHKNLDQ